MTLKLDRWAFEREFELRFLKSRGAAFQDLFSDLLEHAYPGDFVRIRSHGRSGDLKCDGYLTSQKTVFQLYGPEDMRTLYRLINKIKDDYSGAITNWTTRMNQWIFVHNSQSGIPPQALQLIDDLRNSPNAPQIEIWGFENLRNILHQLSDSTLQNLLPCLSDKTSLGDIKQLPTENAVEHYWSWLATKLSEQLSITRMQTLKSLDIPIDLFLPEEAREIRLAEEKDINEFRKNPLATEDGTFDKGVHFGRVNITWTLRKKRHILILGDSGSGKSTFIRRYAKKLVKKLVNNDFSRKRGHTPIIVELWRFAPNRTLLDLIFTSVKRTSANISEGELLHAMDRGYIVLLLDGLDEVSFNYRRDCLTQINDLVEEYPGIQLILTSRPFPKPPDYFYCLEIIPLSNSIIASSLRQRFGKGEVFRKQFNNNDPNDYVRLCIRPEIRQLFRTPLTIGMLITILEHSGSLPDNLFDIFNRFISWLLDWEVQKGNLQSSVSAISVLEETAYVIINNGANSISTSDWLRIAGRILDEIRLGQVSSGSVAEDIFKILLSTGLLQEFGGEVTFSHRSMLEFCAACRIIDLYVSGQFDPVALQSGVACFMCSKLHNVTLLLEEHLSHCADVHEILPLLKEAHIAGGETGRFESLFDAITDSDELGINLSYSPPGEEETTFSKIIDNIVTTCKSFKPKALSVLKTAAESLIWSIQWDQTDPWFEMIVSALEFYNWPGAVFHRRLIKIRFFEYIEAFSDDGSDLEAPYRLRELEAYLDALDKDDFDHALLHLDKLAKILYDYIIKVEGDDAKTNIHHFPAQTLSLQMRLWPNDDSSLFENEV